jgi:hypothetical protein
MIKERNHLSSSRIGMKMQIEYLNRIYELEVSIWGSRKLKGWEAK